MTIAFVGMMGSGKSTVARRVGRELGIPVFDTDSMVERETGRSVAEIFDHDGESEFRRLEAEAVEQACSAGTGVIATGGGVVRDPELLSRLKETGSVVYLRGTPGALAARLPRGRARASRPLLREAEVRGGESAIELELGRILGEREAAYEAAADLVIDIDDLSFAEVARLVVRWWGEQPVE